MPPAPKAPGTRQRRNRTSTSATLRPVEDPEVPDLPALADGAEWHPATVSWWVDTWSSPMSAEFDPSDIHGMLILAALVNGFWVSPSKELAAEIRLQRQCFGLTPIDRRRLQWEIDRGEQAEESRDRRRSKPKPAKGGEDPRASLAG